MLIVNDSELKRVSLPPPLASLDATLPLRYADIGRVPALEAAVSGGLVGGRA